MRVRVIKDEPEMMMREAKLGGLGGRRRGEAEAGPVGRTNRGLYDVPALYRQMMG